MKRFIMLVVISIAGLLACTKNESGIYNRQLAGSWHLDSTCCGFDYPGGIPTDILFFNLKHQANIIQPLIAG